MDTIRLIVFLLAVFSLSLFALATSGSCEQGTANGEQFNPEVSIDPEKTYVLAIGCCVPWKEPHTCSDTVGLFVGAATAKLGIPHKNILSLVGQQATYEGVVNGFKWLSEKSGPDNSIIIYFNGHGTLLPEGSGSGDPEYVFVLWSEEFPFAGLYAVLGRIWMNSLEFSALVNKLPGKAKVVIADTCHALEAWEDIHSKGEKTDYGFKDAALLAAAEAGQLAISTPNYALFTEQLVAAMNSGADNLKEAFDLAQRLTIRESRIACRGIHKKTSKVDCLEQKPTIEDSRNITSLFLLRNKHGNRAQPPN